MLLRGKRPEEVGTWPLEEVVTCIQISKEADQMVWYSHLLKNFPQFIVIHTVKGFGILNKANIDKIWSSLAFSMIQQMLAI